MFHCVPLAEERNESTPETAPSKSKLPAIVCVEDAVKVNVDVAATIFVRL